MQKIDVKLVQDTMNYLTMKPWGEVQALLKRWDESLKQESKESEDGK